MLEAGNEAQRDTVVNVKKCALSHAKLKLLTGRKMRRMEHIPGG